MAKRTVWSITGTDQFSIWTNWLRPNQAYALSLSSPFSSQATAPYPQFKRRLLHAMVINLRKRNLYISKSQFFNMGENRWKSALIVSGWNVLETCVIIGKASSRVLTFLRAFVCDFIRDFDLHILFKSRLALHNKREFITYFARRWERRVFITRPKREKARESPSLSRRNRKGKCFFFSSLLCPLFLLFFPMNFWILLNHCKFAFPVSKWPFPQI